MHDALTGCQVEIKESYLSKNMPKARVGVVIIRKRKPRFFLSGGDTFSWERDSFFILGMLTKNLIIYWNH